MLALVQLSRDAFRVTGPQVLVGLVSGVVVVLCVLFHYEVMNRTSRFLPYLHVRRRTRIVVLILVMTFAHVVEVWIFALVYWALDSSGRFGGLTGTFEEGALDYVYYSVVTFTTLGFGEIVPVGPIRILTGTEALVGLGLITWSASLAFLEMQRDWAEFRR